MAKRYVFNQQHGDRKKAKLDITISDHNFPLSQNTNDIRDINQDNWGDDNDDEILLLASQACEQACNNNISLLPDYSFCMQPGSTSTQYESAPSTSKSAFTFKKPTLTASNAIPTHLKSKFSTISSPLPGMSTKVSTKPTDNVPMTDDLVFNDKICKGQDPDYMYRQLLQLQKENAKLKSENGKLLEKCVTKEGEASILRTQLKSCQVAVDNARLEKIKSQEKVQIEWTDKLNTANNQMHDLRTQLDFKNLEIISIKEKCKKLESSKLKLTQVTLSNNDISSSHRYNSLVQNESSLQAKRVRQISSAVQTDNKLAFIKLNKIYRKESSQLTDILPLILEPTSLQYSLLDYNEKLQRHTEFTRNRCQIFSTFQRLPSTPSTSKQGSKSRITINSIYENLTHIAADNVEEEDLMERHFNLFRALNAIFEEVKCELEIMSTRVTNAFQKEMDEKYLEASTTFLVVERRHLLRGSHLYKDEQAILARRATAAVAEVLRSACGRTLFHKYQERLRTQGASTSDSIPIMSDINRICSLLDSTSCAILYSGFLHSLTLLLQSISSLTPASVTLATVKVILTSRPMTFVCCQLLELIREVSEKDNVLTHLCVDSGTGNLKVDYDQGVMLYKKDSCHLQVLLKQIESCLKCIEAQKRTEAAVAVTRDLVALFARLDGGAQLARDSRCECQPLLAQVVVSGMRVCAILADCAGSDDDGRAPLRVCRAGALGLLRRPALLPPGGALPLAAAQLRRHPQPPLYDNMLAELMSTFQTVPEDTPASFNRLPWQRSFETFSLTD